MVLKIGLLKEKVEFNVLIFGYKVIVLVLWWMMEDDVDFFCGFLRYGYTSGYTSAFEK